MIQLDRCKKLFKEDFEKILQAKVLILGAGGVGGFALDCLYRSGLRDITNSEHNNKSESSNIK